MYNMIEIQLRQYGVFQELIHHVKRHFLEDVQAGKLGLHFDDSDQVRLQGIILQNSAFMDIRLDATKVFEHYQCNESVTIDPNFLALSQVLKQHEDDNVVKVLVSGNSMIVLSERPDRVQKCELLVQSTVFHIASEDINNFKCILTMPTLKLKQESILNGSLGEIFSISAKDNAVYLMSMNFGSLNVTKKIATSSNQASVVINNTLPAMSFDTQYLDRILNALVMSSENTTLSVAEQIPLKLSQDIMEFTNTQGQAEIAGDLKYFVAPRFTEAAENDEFFMPEAFSKTREACFQGQLIHGKKFADIIQSLAKDYGEVDVECSKTKLRISGMCPSHISLAEVVLTTKDFTVIECDKAFSLGCNIQNLARSLRDVKETDVVRLAIDEIQKTIEVMVHTADNQDEISVKEIHCGADAESLPIPRFPFSATVSMPLSLFRDIVATLDGRTCEIGITQDGILFSTDNGSLGILMTNDAQVAFRVKKATKLGFDLCMLRAFANLGSIVSSTVHLSLLASCPLRIQFNAATSEYSSYLSLFLSPRIDKDENKMTAVEERDLSLRIYSSKKATVSSETKKSHKRATAKRRRTCQTTDRKRPRKKQAPRSKKPKKCAKCETIKASEEFLDAELRKTKYASCIDCTLVTCEQNMLVSRISEEDGNTERAEVRALRSLGCERYECPIFFDNKNDNIVTSLQASFNPALPDVTTLFGSYNIVYTFSDCGSEKDGKARYKQRTVHGLLNLTSRHLASTGRNGLYGTVEMEAAIQDYVEPHGGSFSFAQLVEDQSSPSFELSVAIDAYPGDVEAFRRRGDSTGTISLLAGRTATVWNPMENPESSWDKRIVSLETVEDAEKLVECWKRSFLANSWVSNHLLLPPELALKIHEYVAFRPCPAFFFEKDDLWIRISWRRDEQPTMKTILVARRRTS